MGRADLLRIKVDIEADGLSIPFFSATRRVQSLSYTWSRQRTGVPEWLSTTRPLSEGTQSPREDVELHQFESVSVNEGFKSVADIACSHVLKDAARQVRLLNPQVRFPAKTRQAIREKQRA